MAVSNIAAQVYEHQLGTQFRTTPHAQTLHIPRFDFLPASAFLCGLTVSPELTPYGLKVSVDDWKLFKQLKDNSKKVIELVKKIAGRQKATNAEE